MLASTLPAFSAPHVAHPSASTTVLGMSPIQTYNDLLSPQFWSVTLPSEVTLPQGQVLPQPPQASPPLLCQLGYLQAKLQRDAQQHSVWRCAGWRGCLAGILCQLEEQGWGVDILLDGAQNRMQPLGIS